MPTDTLMQTVRQVMKQPPATNLDKNRVSLLPPISSHLLLFQERAAREDYFYLLGVLHYVIWLCWVSFWSWIKIPYPPVFWFQFHCVKIYKFWMLPLQDFSEDIDHLIVQECLYAEADLELPPVMCVSTARGSTGLPLRKICRADIYLYLNILDVVWLTSCCTHSVCAWCRDVYQHDCFNQYLNYCRS